MVVRMRKVLAIPWSETVELVRVLSVHDLDVSCLSVPVSVLLLELCMI